jgi:hypothetical protein
MLGAVDDHDVDGTAKTQGSSKVRAFALQASRKHFVTNL